MNLHYFNIENRRYIGSKTKLMTWIAPILQKECVGATSFFDVFAGTGVVSHALLPHYDTFYINDFLYANEVIYQGFFAHGDFDAQQLIELAQTYQSYTAHTLSDNYFSIHFGDKFFAKNDAKLIGFIRDDIENKYQNRAINTKEYHILLSSLIYSLDKVANTVGHYEAYIKGKSIPSRFVFELIRPIDTTHKNIHIYRQDANVLAKHIKADIAFIDPPYNSRQYSRFYHVLETLIKWDAPELFGVAMKPVEENMSDYCRNKAPIVFDELLNTLDCQYMVVTYNNTYTSKSTSSQNKISLNHIKNSLEKHGETAIFESKHQFFNAGKTQFTNHKEYFFITKVANS